MKAFQCENKWSIPWKFGNLKTLQSKLNAWECIISPFLSESNANTKFHAFNDS